ncbi:MAG: transposase, partial [Candidatus Thiodiazotropha sp. (ex Lucinoma aequizonata)]|nr:transposase [Candidatus Thiodiazotropha sp. (ex Lucinoma aequizonata)]MCU7903431.1 transposase [Candidatus Thiodiazotropha sp. (ex Lucinoma aequizonata)]
IRSYLLKEEFQLYWQYTTPYWTGEFLDQWCTKTMRSKIEPIKRVFDLVKDFGTSQSSKIDSIFDSLFCPDRPAYATIPYCTSTASCSCTTPS